MLVHLQKVKGKTKNDQLKIIKQIKDLMWMDPLDLLPEPSSGN